VKANEVKLEMAEINVKAKKMQKKLKK